MDAPRKPLHVLLVEDSQDDADLTLFALQEGGFDTVHERVETELAMRATLAHNGWDVVISDFRMPQFSASRALSVLREMNGDLPFIAVSACIGEEEAIALMKQGANDFVMKDKLARLAPAIERELRDVAVRREQRLAQEALQASQKLLAGIMSSIGEGILVMDDERGLIFMNPEAERLLGWSKEELLGKDAYRIIHSGNKGTALPKSCCLPSGALEGGQVCRTEEEAFWRKDGSPIFVSLAVSPIMEGSKATASVAAFQDISQRKQAEAELKESRKQLRELSAYLQTVREEERTRIARELHDELGQMLTGVKLHAKWLEMHLPEGEAVLADKMAEMSQLIDSTLDAMRRVAADLRPTMLDDLGLEAAIEWLVEDFGKRTGIEIRLEMSLGYEQCNCRRDAEATTALYRIAQESLTNAARHAEASQIQISLQCDDGRLILKVADNGKGLDASGGRRNALGVVGMRERIYRLGGEFSLLSTPEKGTTVMAIIPPARVGFSGASK